MNANKTMNLIFKLADQNTIGRVCLALAGRQNELSTPLNEYENIMLGMIEEDENNIVDKHYHTSINANNNEKIKNIKYLGLKLPVHFFDMHEIKVLWGVNRDYVFLYIRLLLESVPHQGVLKYNPDLPFSAKDFSILFNIPLDIVESGLKVLADMNLLIIKEDGSVFLPNAAKLTCR